MTPGALLYNDLQRQGDADVTFKRDATVNTEKGPLTAPILARTTAGQEFVLVLSGPLTNDHPADSAIAEYRADGGDIPVIAENELIVRGNLPETASPTRRQPRCVGRCRHCGSFRR